MVNPNGKGDTFLLTNYWKSFKSGTDIRGVASEGVAGEEINLTDENIRKMTGGFLLWLAGRLHRTAGLTVAVGHDSRISAGRISEDVCGALKGAGSACSTAASLRRPPCSM